MKIWGIPFQKYVPPAESKFGDEDGSDNIG